MAETRFKPGVLLTSPGPVSLYKLFKDERSFSSGLGGDRYRLSLTKALQAGDVVLLLEEPEYVDMGTRSTHPLGSISGHRRWELKVLVEETEYRMYLTKKQFHTELRVAKPDVPGNQRDSKNHR